MLHSVLFSNDNQKPIQIKTGIFLLNDWSPVEWKVYLLMWIPQTMTCFYLVRHYLLHADLEITSVLPFVERLSYRSFNLFTYLFPSVSVVMIIYACYLMLSNWAVTDAKMIVTHQKKSELLSNEISGKPFCAGDPIQVNVQQKVNFSSKAKIQGASLTLKCSHSTKDSRGKDITVVVHNTVYKDQSNSGKTFYRNEVIESNFQFRIPHYPISDSCHSWSFEFELQIEMNPDYASTYSIEVE